MPCIAGIYWILPLGQSFFYFLVYGIVLKIKSLDMEEEMKDPKLLNTSK